MGGKSKSSTKTENTQSTTNIVNDGEFAGASNIAFDESDNSIEIEDSNNTDNSNEFDDSFNTDNSSEFDDSFNTDNSVENDGDFSGSSGFSIDNTDNSTTIENDGEFAGNSGNINILDGDAIKEAFDSTDKTIAVLGAQSTEFRNSLAEQAKIFATQLGDNASINASSNAAVLESLDKSNTTNTGVIADLAKSTALEGQDIIANNITSIVKYLLGGLTFVGLGGILVVLVRRKKNA